MEVRFSSKALSSGGPRTGLDGQCIVSMHLLPLGATRGSRPATIWTESGVSVSTWYRGGAE